MVHRPAWSLEWWFIIELSLGSYDSHGLWQCRNTVDVMGSWWLIRHMGLPFPHCPAHSRVSHHLGSRIAAVGPSLFESLWAKSVLNAHELIGLGKSMSLKVSSLSEELYVAASQMFAAHELACLDGGCTMSAAVYEKLSVCSFHFLCTFSFVVSLRWQLNVVI